MSPRLLLVALLLLAFLAAPLAATPGRSAYGRLRAGAAKVAITPTTPQWIGGWGENRMMEGVHDDVWARALYLNDGQTELTLVSLDLVGVFRPDQAPIKQAVADAVGPNVFISCTHTHSGPDTMGLWGPDEMSPGWDAAYIAYVQERVAQAILAAKANAQPARLYFGSGYTKPEDHVSENDQGPVDYEVAVMRVEARNDAKSTIATVFNFACHPEVAGGNHADFSVWKYISSDIGNYAYDQIESSSGGIAIWLQGALGAMVSVDVINYRGWAEAERIGRALGDRALEGVAAAEMEENPELACATTNLNVPLYNESLYGAMMYGIIHYSPDALGANEDSPLGVGMLTDVSVLRIGSLEIATTPGEPYPYIGLNIKQNILTADHKMVLGLCQDELGYILYPYDWNTPLFAYETSVSVGPTIGVDIEAGLTQAKAALPEPGGKKNK